MGKKKAQNPSGQTGTTKNTNSPSNSDLDISDPN